MKRSRQVKIALVAGLALSGCGRRAYDPCVPQTFNDIACQDAIAHHGYYYGGNWYTNSYSYGYSHYYGGYNTFVQTGGPVTSVPSSSWAAPGSSSSGSSSSVSRGIFGSSASGSSGSGSGGGS